jgi:hypothetical protein
MPSPETVAALARARAHVETLPAPDVRPEGERRCRRCGDPIPTHWPNGRPVDASKADRRAYCSGRCRALAQEADRRAARLLGLAARRRAPS